MKRVLTVTVLALAGTAAVAAVTPVRDLPAAVAAWDAAGERAAAVQAQADLQAAQQASVEALVGLLVDGKLTLAEATDQLDSNTQARPVFRSQLAVARPEGTDRDRLAWFLTERAKDRLGSDPGHTSALLARLAAEGK